MGPGVNANFGIGFFPGLFGLHFTFPMNPHVPTGFGPNQQRPGRPMANDQQEFVSRVLFFFGLIVLLCLLMLP